MQKNTTNLEKCLNFLREKTDNFMVLLKITFGEKSFIISHNENIKNSTRLLQISLVNVQKLNKIKYNKS